MSGHGPLAGLRVIELAGIGPAPFAAMVLGDLGADVIRVDRVGVAPNPPRAIDVLARNRRSVAIDLKHPDGVGVLLDLVATSDLLLEGFRPGVAERLGISPDACLARNPRLIYGRMTGWGQDGPLATTAGHDIDYIAVAGVLHMVGRAGERPVPPLNLVGDFGGGGMLLAVGVLAALLEAQRSGEGQVVDAAMVDGAALLTAMFHGFLAAGFWHDDRGRNSLDGGAHYYDTYECADGRYLAVGAMEPQFYAELRERLGLHDPAWDEQLDPAKWPALKLRLAAVLRTRPRDEWCAVFAGSDACVAPVLSMAEAHVHPHNRARSTFVDVDGVTQPAPAPRFSRTVTATPTRAPEIGAHTDEVLLSSGVARDRLDELRGAGVVG